MNRQVNTQNSRKKKSFFGFIIKILLIVVVAVGGFIAFRKFTGNSATKTSPNITIVILEEKLSSIGEFATYKDELTVEDRFKNSKELAGLKIPFTGKSVTMRYKVIIKAGVEVDQIKFKIDDEKRTLTFTLPKAKILSTEIDTDSIEVEEQNGLFNHTTVEDGTELLKTMKDAAEVSAKKAGLLEKANDHAKDLVIDLFSDEGYNVIVK